MRSDDRKDLATATVGAGGLAAGGVGRHAAVRAMTNGGVKEPKVHAVGIMRRGTKGQKKLYVASSLLGLAATAPLGVGVTRLATGRDIEKREEPKRGFLAEGLRGSAGALRGRGEAALQPVPKEVRAAQLGIAAGAGFGGGALARAALRGKTKGLRPAVAPVIGGLAATGSIPVTNKVIADRGYKVTPYGVKRTKQAAVRPSSKASLDRPGPRSFREDLAKQDRHVWSQTADDRKGRSIHLINGQRAPKDTYLPAMIPISGDKPYARKGRLMTLSATDSGPARPTTRTGGAAFHGKLPIRNARIREAVDEMHEASRYASDVPKSLLQDPTKHFKQARFRYVAPRAALGAAALGGAALAVSQRKKQVRKADERGRSYLGARTPHMTQRAAVTAAGHPPFIGPITQAASAASFAPPGQGGKHARRQYALGSGAGVLTGAAGAYAGAHLAAKSPKFEQRALGGLKRVEGWENKARSAVGMKTKERDFTKAPKGRILGSKLAKPLTSTSARRVGATAGFFGVKAATGAIGGQTAISMNQRDQKAYNAKHGIVAKRGPDLGTTAERKDLSRKKRASAVLSGAGGVAGLSGLGLLLAGKKDKALAAGSIGGGLGGLNALLNVPIQRKEAKAIDPVRKAASLAKRDSLEIKYKDEHPGLIARYGDKGPLPSKLDRETKMKAYEARYVHHGGDRADKYGRRADKAEAVRNVGLATATAGGAAFLAAKTKRGKAIADRLGPRTRSRADNLAIAGGVVGGGAELYGEYARGRRASYTNSPAGVAGSALRRMRDYTP